MDNKLSELKATALAATPGPWSWKVDGIFYYLSPEGVNTPLERIIDDGSAWGEYAETIEHDGPDARFIASANPATVLDLLAELEAKEAKIVELRNRGINAVTAEERTSTEWQKRAEVAEAKLNHYVAVEYARTSFDQTADIIKRADDAEREVEELRTKLATPVRLPPLMDGELCGKYGAKYGAAANAHNNAITACSIAICGAGFKSEVTAPKCVGDE